MESCDQSHAHSSAVDPANPALTLLLRRTPVPPGPPLPLRTPACFLRPPACSLKERLFPGGRPVIHTACPVIHDRRHPGGFVLRGFVCLWTLIDLFSLFFGLLLAGFRRRIRRRDRYDFRHPPLNSTPEHRLLRHRGDRVMKSPRPHPRGFYDPPHLGRAQAHLPRNRPVAPPIPVHPGDPPVPVQNLPLPGQHPQPGAPPLLLRNPAGAGLPTGRRRGSAR